MRLWERAEALAAHCTQWLDTAEKRITASDS
jgi:exonuclease VII small subunit